MQVSYMPGNLNVAGGGADGGADGGANGGTNLGSHLGGALGGIAGLGSGLGGNCGGNSRLLNVLHSSASRLHVLLGHSTSATLGSTSHLYIC